MTSYHEILSDLQEAQARNQRLIAAIHSTRENMADARTMLRALVCLSSHVAAMVTDAGLAGANDAHLVCDLLALVIRTMRQLPDIPPDAPDAPKYPISDIPSEDL